MKKPVEKRKPSGIVDYIALTLTTFGVGYFPGATGTYGSAVAVMIYILMPKFPANSVAGFAVNSVALAIFCLVGIWAAGRSIPLLGSGDPSEAVVDEVMGQFITFAFIPFGLSWPFILAGFLLFRLFDIVKPFPARTLEDLPGGLGICADDIMSGVYAGICLAVGYAVYLAI
ncbi:MAG: phosphatidylglycerophosphatase A [Pyrinomonadaceae bacterium]